MTSSCATRGRAAAGLGVLLALIAFQASAAAAVLGTHVHELGTGESWPPPGFTSVRLWDARVTWADLEPAPNEWRFERLDRIVSEAVQQQRALLLPLALSPRWASSRPDEGSAYRPGNAAAPRSLADWTRYVETVARRYRGRITAYEGWNEPNRPHFFSGDVAEAVRLTCEARRVIKSIDPAALLVSPAATGQLEGIEWLGRFLAAGGAACIDVVGFHFYTLAHEPPEALLPLVSAVRETMRRHEVAHLPLWDTEFGWFIANTVAPVNTRYKVLPQEIAAAYLARAWLLRASAGLERAYFYAWNNGNMGLIEPDTRLPKPAAPVLPRVQGWIGGETALAACASTGGLWRCPLNRGGREVGQVAWAARADADGAMLRLVASARERGASLQSADGAVGPPFAPGMPVRMLWP